MLTMRSRLSKLHLLCLGLLFMLSTTGTVAAAATPADMQDFNHYTFAVMWHPGVCATWTNAGAACKDLSPEAKVNREWTMHGLWASRPQKLMASGMNGPTWWHYGCYWFNPNHALPKDSCANPALNLPTQLHQRLYAHMPMANICLDRHEYYKHVACFGETPEQFFPKELNLLDKLNATSFTAFIRNHRGQWVSRNAILHAFAESFKVKNGDALELRCETPGRHTHETEHQGTILTQAWITIHQDKLDEFPAAGSLEEGRKGNCAEKIHILK